MTGTRGKRDYFFTAQVKDTKNNLLLNQRVGCLRALTDLIEVSFLSLALKSEYILDSIFQTETGNVSQGNIGSDNTLNLDIALPPIEEQKRIVIEVDKCFKLIDTIEQNQTDLKTAIEQTKSKVLDLAIHGKLVPQDPNDEPASELLKRINPNAEITCDNGHYAHLPQGWATCKLEDIVDYEQPQAYIVKTTDYSDSYSTPVLTAGKSFIIGYTNETSGVYDKLPTIIFDDFTTDSKLVNFKFKVKSSAMKILQVNVALNIKYVYNFMKITRLIGDTHKRYWISEYSKLLIPIPPIKEQNRIVKRIDEIYQFLNKISEAL